MRQWPDWRGQTGVVVGTGPSARQVDFEVCRSFAKVFAIKTSWKLVPWADALYGLDKGWWIVNSGVPEFAGLKVTPSPTAARVFGLNQVKLKSREEILTEQVGVIGCGLKSGGGYSGFQVVNLMVQFGVKRIVLVGYDMTLDNGPHWHPYAPGTGKPDKSRTESWRKSFDGASEQFKCLGVEVINASEVSRLTAYPKMKFEDIKWQ